MSATAILGEIRLGPESAGIVLTPEEFDAADEYDDGFRYELIHGVLVVTPMASGAERSPNDLLGYWLNNYRYQHPAGACLVETVFEHHLRTRGNRRRAYRVVWVAYAGHTPDPRTDVPTIVVEFVSPGKAAFTRDYIEKREEYLEAGVSEYWIVDRIRRTLTVHSQRAGRKPTERAVNADETYQTDLLPGFELPFAELLAAADRWSDAGNS